MLVVDIEDLALSDGDYEVSVLDRGQILQQSILRLRSSNTPDAATRRAVTTLAHDVGVTRSRSCGQRRFAQMSRPMPWYAGQALPRIARRPRT